MHIDNLTPCSLFVSEYVSIFFDKSSGNSPGSEFSKIQTKDIRLQCTFYYLAYAQDECASLNRRRTGF